jgi:hypothetical protein
MSQQNAQIIGHMNSWVEVLPTGHWTLNCSDSLALNCGSVQYESRGRIPASIAQNEARHVSGFSLTMLSRGGVKINTRGVFENKCTR